MEEKIGLKGRFVVECLDKEGRLKWREEFDNLIVNQGKNHTLDTELVGGAQITTWYLGLTGSAPTAAAADTMGSHAGWTEVTAYAEATRPQCQFAAASGQATTNSANKAVFSINGSATIGGGFVVSNNTKGGGTGTLFSVGAFVSGDRAVVSTDTVNVTYTVST